MAKKGKALVKGTTTLIEPGVDVRADLDAINRGLAARNGDLFTVNGRTYRVDGQDHTYPAEGEGFHRLDRATFKALQVLR